MQVSRSSVKNWGNGSICPRIFFNTPRNLILKPYWKSFLNYSALSLSRYALSSLSNRDTSIGVKPSSNLSSLEWAKKRPLRLHWHFNMILLCTGIYVLWYVMKSGFDTVFLHIPPCKLSICVWTCNFWNSIYPNWNQNRFQDFDETGKADL